MMCILRICRFASGLLIPTPSPFSQKLQSGSTARAIARKLRAIALKYQTELGALMSIVDGIVSVALLLSTLRGAKNMRMSITYV